MVSLKTIFWEVDVQADFMLPGGSLYIPGAEKIMANINLLVDAARQGRVFLISSADAHNANDPELSDWPPHCFKGTPAADLLPEACASPRLVIANQEGFTLPKDLGAYRQVTLEKKHARRVRQSTHRPALGAIAPHRLTRFCTSYFPSQNSRF